MRFVDQPTARRPAQRRWIIEALVVVGVVAFGYYAMTEDPMGPPPAGSILSELVR